MACRKCGLEKKPAPVVVKYDPKFNMKKIPRAGKRKDRRAQGCIT